MILKKGYGCLANSNVKCYLEKKYHVYFSYVTLEISSRGISVLPNGSSIRRKYFPVFMSPAG